MKRHVLFVLASLGLKLHTHNTPASVVKDPDTGLLTLTTTDGKDYSGFDVVVMAVGREPAVDRLNLESTGVEVGAIQSRKPGIIKVNEYQQTNVPGQSPNRQHVLYDVHQYIKH